MSFSLESISKGRARKAPRIVLLGVEKIGKSTFASQADSPIFIPMKGEKGIDEINCHKFPAANTYDDIMECLRVLYQEDHEYKTVVLDSISAAEPVVWEAACKAANCDTVEKIGGGFGKWKNEMLPYWRQLTEGLDALREDRGIGSILIGHLRTREFNDPETDSYTQYQFDVQDNVSALLYRWCDLIGFANFKRAIVKKEEAGFNKTRAKGVGTGSRVLLTEKRPAHPGGNRYRLPYELPLSWEALRKAIDESDQPKSTQATTKAQTA